MAYGQTVCGLCVNCVWTECGLCVDCVWTDYKEARGLGKAVELSTLEEDDV